MAQHAISDQERDTLLAAAKLSAAGSAVVAGVLNHQTSDEVTELVDTVLDALQVLQTRRDELEAQEKAGQTP